MAPGGGGSNVWSFALGGDVDLSITMTFISSIAALGKHCHNIQSYLLCVQQVSELICTNVRSMLFIDIHMYAEYI